MDEPNLKTKVGTPAFEAPEVGDPRSVEYTNMVDIWLLGCLLYWVLTKAVPFYTAGHGSLSDFIEDETRFPLRGLRQANLSETGIDFLRKTIKINPHKRLTSTTALNHPWLQELSSWDSTLAERIAEIPDPLSSNEQDIILVLGPTGVGKSSFIHHFVEGGRTPKVGAELASETQGIEAFQCISNGHRFLVVDTPGFDDSYWSETSVFEELVSWLAATFSSNVRLTGVILMTSILSVRLGGSLRRPLRYVKKLCGPDLNGVVYVSTFWDRLESEALGVSQEDKMRRTEEFDWVMGGCRPSFRSAGSEAAANAVVSYLLDRSKPMTLQIQHELVEQDQPLHQTVAGLFLTEDMFQIRNLYEKEIALLQEELKEATKDDDKEAQKELDNALQDLLSRIKKVDEDLAQMKTGHRQMIDRKLCGETPEGVVEDENHCARGAEDTAPPLEMTEDSEATTRSEVPKGTLQTETAGTGAIGTTRTSKHPGKLSEWVKRQARKFK
ncbi:hypothetical protein OQA88_9095 [Cercophora sp. LCS_1]